MHDAVMQRTGLRIPVESMHMHEWFVPAKLHEWWPRAKGVCRRLGQHPDGRVNCEWRPFLTSTEVVRFTLRGDVVREVLAVSFSLADAA